MQDKEIIKLLDEQSRSSIIRSMLFNVYKDKANDKVCTIKNFTIGTQNTKLMVNYSYGDSIIYSCSLRWFINNFVEIT